MTNKANQALIPWATIQHEMAVQLAALFADHPAEVPADLRGQPLTADTIEAWSEKDVVTAWFSAYRRHGDRLGFDWSDICNRHADVIEAHRLAIEAQYGKSYRSV